MVETGKEKAQENNLVISKLGGFVKKNWGVFLKKEYGILMPYNMVEEMSMDLKRNPASKI